MVEYVMINAESAKMIIATWAGRVDYHLLIPALGVLILLWVVYKAFDTR